MHNYHDLITLFDNCFFKEYNTRIIKGGSEPIYLPADEQRPYHALFFANGFFSSALHECSHWLIAGEERRKKEDFGYWYVPDGRNLEQQQLFQKVEIKPQALEWILSKASGYKFNISIDNLCGSQSDSNAFKKAIHNQVTHYCQNGLPKRAEKFRNALCSFYNQPSSLRVEDFSLKEL